MESVGGKPHSFLRREGPKLFEMFGRAGRLEKGSSEALAVDDVNLETGRRGNLRPFLPIRLRGHQGEIGNQFAAPPEITGDSHVLEFRTRPF
jgi:hypothetical protein